MKAADGPACRAGQSRPRAARSRRLQRRPDHAGHGSPARHAAARRAARRAERAPLRGQVRVIVVLVDFSDQPMTETPQHFEDLFFSTGKLPHGSVEEYFREVSGGMIDHHRRGGRAVPDAAAARWYATAASASGTDNPAPERADHGPRRGGRRPTRTSTSGPTTTTATASSTRSSSSTPAAAPRRRGDPGDIWSHKWVFGGGAFNADGTKVFALPDHPRGRQDRRLRARARPPALRLARTSTTPTITSEGLGNWCLMAGGSWNGGGDIPAHPSAWCKAGQGWVSTVNRTTSRHADDRRRQDRPQGLPAVEGRHRRARSTSCREPAATDYDAKLPGEGLLV